ncbi:MAG: SMP-30/gluconolactonase/LRE family protein [Acidimicrobiia bacterium]|nr:SMP-30/gluconolactonase/LRE family protein [Acidimicrobiia bacterium]
MPEDPMAMIESVGHAPASLGECPVWSGYEQALYWADIDGRAIHRLEPSTGTTTSRVLPGRPGSFVLTTDPNRLLVASEHELVVLNWATGETSSWRQLEEAGTGNRLNDGRCDPAGRYVVGSMYADTSAGRWTGALYRVGHVGDATTLRSKIGVTNGLAFDAERQRMYFADTPTDCVLVFDYDIESGEASNERIFLDYSELPGKPDGACVDADGCYWSASVYGWAVIRVTPQGVVDRRIELPVQKPSMPAFGGADLSTLFVTTIGAGGTVPSEPGRQGFQPGELLAIDAGTQGRPEALFPLSDR